MRWFGSRELFAGGVGRHGKSIASALFTIIFKLPPEHVCMEGSAS
jgi:hypothetical protein